MERGDIHIGGGVCVWFWWVWFGCNLVLLVVNFGCNLVLLVLGGVDGVGDG